MEATKKEKEAMHECYVRLYVNSNPSADFNELLDNAEVDERGFKHIDFMSYEIEENIFNDIINDVIEEYKIKPEYRARAFKNAIYLGASPKFKNEEDK